MTNVPLLLHVQDETAHLCALLANLCDALDALSVDPPALEVARDRVARAARAVEARKARIVE
jgi:hypothetical protein